MANQKIPPHLQIWIDARRRFKLTHAQVQMARELGLNPKKLGGKANHTQEPWKSPLGEFIQDLYFRRFKKEQPDEILSIEDRAKMQHQKKMERKAARQERAQQSTPEGSEEAPADEVGESEIPF